MRHLPKIAIELDCFNLFGIVFQRERAEIANALAPQVLRAFGTCRLLSNEDLKSRGLQTACFNYSFKYVGWLLLMTLKAILPILNLMRCRTGSQCNFLKIGSELARRGALLTTRADEF